jgi:hypothetical protein
MFTLVLFNNRYMFRSIIWVILRQFHVSRYWNILRWININVMIIIMIMHVIITESYYYTVSHSLAETA